MGQDLIQLSESATWTFCRFQGGCGAFRLCRKIPFEEGKNRWIIYEWGTWVTPAEMSYNMNESLSFYKPACRQSPKAEKPLGIENLIMCTKSENKISRQDHQNVINSQQ